MIKNKKEAIKRVEEFKKVRLKNEDVYVKTNRENEGYWVVLKDTRNIYFVYKDSGSVWELI